MTIEGSQIRDARERAGMTQAELGHAVGVTLRTIGNWERGESVPRNREAKLREVLAATLGNGSGGVPVTAENLDPRLNNIERQIDALWRRLDELGGSSVAVEVGATGAGVAQMRPRTGPPEPPDEAPAPPLDAAANDPGVPSVGEQKREQQDREAERGDV